MDLKEYNYERGEGRYKHVWKKQEAGFEPSPRGPIGKCDSRIDQTIAEQLLKNGIVEDDPVRLPSGLGPQVHPEKIFNIYKGVPYVAVPTQPGKSYHGYPFRGRMTRSVERKLRDRATNAGVVRLFDKWMKKCKK